MFPAKHPQISPRNIWRSISSYAKLVVERGAMEQAGTVCLIGVEHIMIGECQCKRKGHYFVDCVMRSDRPEIYIAVDSNEAG